MNFIIISTKGGKGFARKISNSIIWINHHQHPNQRFYPHTLSASELYRINNYEARDTQIHARVAYPENTGWMQILTDLERSGYKVINNTNVLKLTSDKLKCSTELQRTIPHPRTLEINKSTFPSRALLLQWLLDNNLDGELIAKPTTSMSQGSHVKKFNISQLNLELLSDIPGNKVVLQECIPYLAIYRVIVIGGNALPFVFVDRPTPERWKVSVCLNKEQKFVPAPDRELLALAERTQRAIRGEINFIDIFETSNGYIISEINTACNLSLHERISGKNIHYQIAKYLVREAMLQ